MPSVDTAYIYRFNSSYTEVNVQNESLPLQEDKVQVKQTSLSLVMKVLTDPNASVLI